MRIQRKISEPLRVNPDFEERWNGVDHGVITSWEKGRERRDSIEQQWIDMVEAARTEEFPKTGLKKTTPHYTAQLQGMRNQDLDVEVWDD